MNIVILNGSPKKDTSVTMQYMKFLEKSFPQHNFHYIHASFYCRKMENNGAYFKEVMNVVRTADAVIWAFPLYYLLVHSQYKRFIELIFERGMEGVFEGKYTAALSTSIHFFDHTAHNYIRAVCDDLGMKYVDFFPAKMQDLTDRKKQSSLLFFFRKLENHIARSLPTAKAFHPVTEKPFRYEPGASGGAAVTVSGQTVIVADYDETRPNVRTMAERTSASFGNAEIINLRGIETGPCLGCLKCGFGNVCGYGENDPFVKVLRNGILPSQRIVFILGMHDRYFSHVWQRYLERNFVHTHQPVLTGKQVSFLVSGPLERNHNAREILQGYAETMQADLVSIVSDECRDASTLDVMIDSMAREMIDRSLHGIVKPPTFLGVGGMKVFRDDIAGGLRFVFQGDHRYYKKHGIYDFPHKKRLVSLGISLLVLLSKIPFVRKKIQENMKAGMLSSFRKVLRDAGPMAH